MYQASGGACAEDPSGVRLRGRLCFEGVIGASVRSRTVGKMRPAPTFLTGFWTIRNPGTVLIVQDPTTSDTLLRWRALNNRQPRRPKTKAITGVKCMNVRTAPDVHIKRLQCCDFV